MYTFSMSIAYGIAPFYAMQLVTYLVLVAPLKSSPSGPCLSPQYLSANGIQSALLNTSGNSPANAIETS
jgi:hypothetical protein